MRMAKREKTSEAVMRIQCEKCGTYYRVAQEKITDRTVHVRCQRCQTEMVIVGPPSELLVKPLAKSMAPQIRLGAQRRRQARRRSFFRGVGRSAVTLLVLLLVGLGSYFMTTTPGIPRVYAVAFIALNGVVWGAFAARAWWNQPTDAPAR